ncbi:MAG: hypothetical protein EOO15_16350 [Chitinophagaceae bacterium]|nr:MAG: hypothetical protein EOO15_16350 [Chitinophagaceae bacterium]
MSGWQRVVAALCSLVVATGAAVAQSSKDSLRRVQIVDACKQAAAGVLQEMQPMLNNVPGAPKTKDLVLFTPDIVYSALARYDLKRIEITYGTCHEVFMLAHAAAYAFVVDPSAALELEAYGKSVTSAYSQAIKQAGSGARVWVEVPQFHEWLGRESTISEAQKLELDRQTEKLLFDGMAQMLGHELAHLALSHRADFEPPDLRVQEAQADKLGLQLARPVLKLPGNPMLLAPMFGLMNREYPLREDLESEHPHSACRIAYASQQLGVADLPDHGDFPPQYKQYLKSKLDEARRKTGLNIKSFGEIYERVLQGPMCLCYSKNCEVPQHPNNLN